MVTPVVTSIGGFFALVLTTEAIFSGPQSRKRCRSTNLSDRSRRMLIFKKINLSNDFLWCPLSATTAVKVNVESKIQKDEVLAQKKQHFTSSEVLSITNNFKLAIEEGGFGTVYHGYLNDLKLLLRCCLTHQLKSTSNSIWRYKFIQYYVFQKEWIGCNDAYNQWADKSSV